MTGDICDALRSDIAAGKFPPGKRLPGFRELAGQYDCSRGTIENAVRILADEGLLRTVHGKGTFLADTGTPLPRKVNRIAGAVLLRNGWLEAMEKLRDEYLKKGWFVSTYCSSEDLQNPAAEKQFLEHALAQNFAAVILVGTPLEPLNTELYRKMRRAGMKVLHLTHYKDDMSGEAAILPDYRMAGALACSAAAMRGCRNLVYLAPTPVLSPSTRWRQIGMTEMIGALHLNRLDDMLIPRRGGNITDSDFAKFLPFLKKLPPGTAILADSCELLHAFHLFRNRAGFSGEPLFDLSLSGTSPLAPLVNHVSFNYEESIRLAMDYVMDNNLLPLSPFQKNLPPELFLCEDSDSSKKGRSK